MRSFGGKDSGEMIHKIEAITFALPGSFDSIDALALFHIQIIRSFMFITH